LNTGTLGAGGDGARGEIWVISFQSMPNRATGWVA
jgi:hypothetical protein